MPRQRHDFSAPGHALALALAAVTNWKPFKYNEGTKDEVWIRPLTKQQLHREMGQGARRVRHHSTRPKHSKQADPFAATKKVKTKGGSR